MTEEKDAAEPDAKKEENKDEKSEKDKEEKKEREQVVKEFHLVSFEEDSDGECREKFGVTRKYRMAF